MHLLLSILLQIFHLVKGGEALNNNKHKENFVKGTLSEPLLQNDFD